MLRIDPDLEDFEIFNEFKVIIEIFFILIITFQIFFPRVVELISLINLHTNPLSLQNVSISTTNFATLLN